MPELTLSSVVVPAKADDDDGADFRSVVAMHNAYCRGVRGDDEWAMTPEQALPHWQDQTDRQIDGYLARRGGEVVASCSVSFGQDEGASAGELSIRVARDRWGTGIGSEVVPFLERLILARGRTTVQCFTDHAESAGDHVVAATGFGSVPNDHVARFLVRHVFVLEQVYRNSRLSIGSDLDEIRALTSGARGMSDPDYRTVWWEVPTPDVHLDDYAWMKSRMSTDAPTGDLDLVEEAWDADRVRRLDSKRTGGGYRVFVTAAEHAASGRLVAFTELTVNADRPHFAHQEDTLVLREHRGRRLGMLLKGENLLRMHDLMPEVRDVETFNAEENRPMLSINEAMGFAPVRYAGEWQKRLG